MKTPLRLDNNKKIDSKPDSTYGETTGVSAIRRCFDTFNQSKKLPVTIKADDLRTEDKEKLDDGYIKIQSYDNERQDVKIWAQSKQRSKFERSFKLSDENISILTDSRGVETMSFIWFQPVFNKTEKKWKVYYKIIYHSDLDCIKKMKKVTMDKSKFFIDDPDSVSDFFNEWREIYRKQQHVLDQLRPLILILMDPCPSTSKIAPITDVTILTKNETEETERIHTLENKIISLEKNKQSTVQLIEELKINLTLQSKFFKIANQYIDKKGDYIFKNILPDLITDYSNVSSSDAEELKETMLSCLIFIKNMVCDCLSVEIQNYLFDILKLLKYPENKSNYYQILQICLQLNLLSGKLLNLLLEHLLLIANQCILNDGILWDYAKIANKIYDQDQYTSLEIFKVLLKNCDLSLNNGPTLNIEIQTFVKQQVQLENKTPEFIDFLKSCFIKWADKENYKDFPFEYLNFVAKNSNFDYYQALEKSLLLLDKETKISIFKKWLNDQNIYESLIFFIYRFSKTNNLMFNDIDEIIEIINTVRLNSGLSEIKNYWLGKTRNGFTPKYYISSDYIKEWISKNPKKRSQYLNWSNQDFIDSLEDDDNNWVTNNNFDSLDEVLTSLDINSSLSLEKIWTILNNYQFKNLEFINKCYSLFLKSYLISQRTELVKIKFLLSLNLIDDKFNELSVRQMFFFVSKKVISWETAGIVDEILKWTISYLSNCNKIHILEIKDFKSSKDCTLFENFEHNIYNNAVGCGVEILLCKLLPYYYFKDITKFQIIYDFISDFDSNEPLLTDVILYYVSSSDYPLEIKKEFWNTNSHYPLIKNVFNKLNFHDFNLRYHLYILILKQNISSSEPYLLKLNDYTKKFFNKYTDDKELLNHVFGINCWSDFCDPLLLKILCKQKDLNINLKIDLLELALSDAEAYRKMFEQKKNKDILIKRYIEKVDLLLQWYDKFPSKEKDFKFLDKLEFDYTSEEDILDYFRFWSNQPVYKKYLEIMKGKVCLYRPPFLTQELLSTSKELRGFVLEFFYHICLNIGNSSISSEIISINTLYIARTDKLPDDEKVISICKKLLDLGCLHPSIVELNKYIKEN